MTNNSPNRIAAILNYPHSSFDRSPAQREASKNNGSLSRGPTSQAGKAISAQNALKHGLRSGVLIPPGDRADFDSARRRILSKLQRELHPQTFTEEMEVRSIAHDYFVSDVARQMIDALLQPRQLPEKDATFWRQLRECRRDLSRIKRAIANYQAGEPWSSSLAQATPLAERLHRFLVAVKTTLVEDQNPDLDPLISEEIELRKPMMKMLAILGPYRDKLANCDYLVKSLMDPMQLTKLQRRRIEALLEYAVVMLSRRPMERADTVTSKVEKLHDVMLAQSASNPTRLVLFQQYLARLDRGVRRKIAAFRRR
jgi:hypothetical protein